MPSRRFAGLAVGLVAAALILGGCAGTFASDPCSREVGLAVEDPVSEAELRAAKDRIDDLVYELPGVGASFVDRDSRQMVYEIASGDDGGAGTCAAVADILDETGVPYALRVFEASAEQWIRTTVGISRVWASEEPVLELEVASCNGDPEITALEETDGQVSIEVTATVAGPGWISQACADNLSVPLQAPLGERTLTDLTTGEAMEVYGRADK